MRITGVEPARLLTLEPKSSASTNFATPAGDGIVPEITAEEKFESISID